MRKYFHGIKAKTADVSDSSGHLTQYKYFPEEREMVPQSKKFHLGSIYSF